MKIIGLGHYSRTGKDTLANYMVQYGGARVKKLPWAWKLKQICYELYAWAGVYSPEVYDTKECEYLRDVPLPLLANDRWPQGPTPVDLWVALGTPAVRDNVHNDTWINYVLKSNHDCEILVIPDVRFLNEAEAVKAAGGTLVKVVRPGIQPRNTVADQALANWEGWDYTVGHSGFLEELESFAEKMVSA